MSPRLVPRLVVHTMGDFVLAEEAFATSTWYKVSNSHVWWSLVFGLPLWVGLDELHIRLGIDGPRRPPLLTLIL